jgi:TetR/AcrR family transcriptional regulator, transcriptional repressor for nem operon
MTNSAAPRTEAKEGKEGKRHRLVAAARDVVHRQGVEKTTLADIALAADVPLGNVYYYFKTKDELVEAAIESQAQEIVATLRALEHHRSPKARLKAFVRALCAEADLVARYGCPLGSLCSELDKRSDDVERAGARLLQLPIAWLAGQFQAMGRRDADELAMALMAAYQGIALLANTFRDPALMTNECRRLERWIDSLAT